MSNAGTWLVGRLRTRQDRARVLDGLSSVGVDPEAIREDLATLPQRSFLVIDGKVTAVTSRQTLSYLRGPLTRAEVARLGHGWKGSAEADDGWLSAPPTLPEGLTPRWLTAAGLGALGLTPVDPKEVVWTPVVYGRLVIRFDADVVLEERTLHRLVRHAGGADSLDGLPEADAVELADDWLARTGPKVGRYAPVPGWLGAPGAVTALTRRWLSAAVITESGPPEALSAERDDVELRGLALVWVPVRP